MISPFKGRVVFYGGILRWTKQNNLKKKNIYLNNEATEKISHAHEKHHLHYFVRLV